MFRPPILTLLVSGQIGGVSDAFQATTESLRDALLELHEDARLQNIAAYGAGRFVSTGVEEAGTGGLRLGASLELPHGTWLIGGAHIAIADLRDWVDDGNGGYVALDDPPGDGTWWGYLLLIYDPDLGYSLAVEWLAAAVATYRAAGTPCVGKVTVEGGTPTAIDVDPADVIWSAALLQAKVKALAAGGGSGSGSGAAFFTTLPVAEDDATGSLAYVKRLIAESETRTREEQAIGGDRSLNHSLDDIVHELQIARQIGGFNNRTALERSRSGNIMATSDGVVYGIGGDHPDHLLSTNLVMNADGSFEP